MKRFDIISIFPESFESYLNVSIVKRAIEKKLIAVRRVNPRDFARDKHRKADDTPYGGGPGMVMKVEPIARAVAFAKRADARAKKKMRTRTVLFSTRGPVFDAATARRLARYDRLILICGRYEGVDERVAKYVADEELSIGNFVLAGGELAALVVLEAVARHVPGVLGKTESLEEIKGSYPVYTRPPVFAPPVGKGKRKKKWAVPAVLQGGDHEEIRKWRNRGASG